MKLSRIGSLLGLILLAAYTSAPLPRPILSRHASMGIDKSARVTFLENVYGSMVHIDPFEPAVEQQFG